jgi:PleD family two-component response regulator
MRDLVPDGLTVSIGVATNVEGNVDAYRLLAAADRGLYVAKQAGRNRSIGVTEG